MPTPLQRVPTDLHAFGDSKKPRPPRVAGHNLKSGQKADIIPQAGMVGPTTPGGASTFADPTQAPINGHYHFLPAGTELPEGLGVLPDGGDVGGPHARTHHTITPTKDMPPQDFIDLFNRLPWRYGGKTT
jgi:hypothetical protein